MPTHQVQAVSEKGNFYSIYITHIITGRRFTTDGFFFNFAFTYFKELDFNLDKTTIF